jgi:hypothetical protein
MFKPLNRHLLIEKVEKDSTPEEKSLVLLPDDYEVKSQFGLYQVVGHAPDCEKIDESFMGCGIVVEESMVKEITVHKQRYYLILENYIYGVT